MAEMVAGLVPGAPAIATALAQSAGIGRGIHDQAQRLREPLSVSGSDQMATLAFPQPFRDAADIRRNHGRRETQGFEADQAKRLGGAAGQDQGRGGGDEPIAVQTALFSGEQNAARKAELLRQGAQLQLLPTGTHHSEPNI